MEIDFTKKPEQTIDEGVEKTKKIISCLKNIVKQFNSESAEKVSFQQLKGVFLEGAKTEIENKSVLLCGFARLNMFLRLSNSSGFVKEFKLGSSLAKKSLNNLDFSQYISPRDEDFDKAERDLLKYNITFSLGSVDELYFSDYEYLPRYEEYL